MPETLTTEAPNSVIVDQGLLYFRATNGEVFSADAADGEVMKKVRRGVTPLFEYGQFGSAAYYMDNPFEPLFQAGGAEAMSVDQVVSLGYHLRPPLVPTCDKHVGTDGHLAHVGSPHGRNTRERGCWNGAQPVAFPQLAGRDFAPVPECEYCGRDDLATMQALRQHQSVMHVERRQQAELADGIVAGLMRSGALPSGGGSSAAEIAAAVVIALRQLEQPQTKPAPARQRDPKTGHFISDPVDDDDDEE